MNNTNILRTDRTTPFTKSFLLVALKSSVFDTYKNCTSVTLELHCFKLIRNEYFFFFFMYIIKPFNAHAKVLVYFVDVLVVIALTSVSGDE